MMNFRLIRDSISEILNNAESGRYRTIGYQTQSTSADEIKDLLRTVSVYYKSGNFDKSSGVLRGPTQHDMVFNIELLASKAVSIDLLTLNNPDSSAAQRQNTLLLSQEASYLVDQSMDELIDIVYQVLMDAENIDLGLGKGVVNNRWVNQPEKGDINDDGELVSLSALMQLTCRTQEEVDGDEGIIPAEPIYDSSLEINEDPEQKTGVLTQ